MINKLKTEDAGKLTMPAGKFLVTQLKERNHIVTRQLPKGDKPVSSIDTVVELEEVKNREPYYIQFYQIIAVPAGETEYSLGDIVCAAFSAGATFDLINKSKVLNKFDIICKYVNS